MSESQFPIDLFTWRANRDAKELRSKAENAAIAKKLGLTSGKLIEAKSARQEDIASCGDCPHLPSASMAIVAHMSLQKHVQLIATFVQAQLDAVQTQLDLHGDSYMLEFEDVVTALEQIKQLAESDPEW